MKTYTNPAFVCTTALLIFSFFAFAAGAFPLHKDPPVNAKVDKSLSLLLELRPSNDARNLVLKSHREWVDSRKSYCASFSSGLKPSDDGPMKTCFDSYDRQRVDFLNLQRLVLLLEVSPPAYGPTAVNLSYSPEQMRNPNRVRSLAVASSAPVAAVTFDANTEVYDLATGRMMCRVETLNEDSRRGQYDFHLTPNGRVFIATYRWPKTGIRIWDTRNGDLLFEKMILPLEFRFLMSQGKHFMFGSHSGTAGIYDIASGETFWHSESGGSVHNMALSGDDSVLLLIREKSVEYRELTGSGRGMTFPVRNSRYSDSYLGTYHFVTVSQDKKAFYGSKTFHGEMVEWELPGLKISRHYQFPGFSNVRLTPVRNSSLFLMEGFTKNNEVQGYMVDMRARKGARIFDYPEKNGKLVVLDAGKAMVASPLAFRISSLPAEKDFRSFGELFPGYVETEGDSLPPSGSLKQKKETAAVDCGKYRFEIIEVYEGTLPGGAKRGFRETVPGYVDVNIGKTDLPVKLVLYSYEPVIWRLSLSSNARLSEVLLAGSNASNIEGARVPMITYMGNASYRSGRSRSSRSVSELLHSHTGCSVTRSQKTYTGNNFYIGEAGSPESRSIYKRIDEHGAISYSDR